MSLLTSGCKLANAQYKLADVNQHLHNTNVIIIWHLQEVFQENKLRLMFCKPLFIIHVRVKGLLSYTAVQK